MNVLVLSGHDYRSPLRASLHFMADELARRGKVRFFSLGFSALSPLINDPRASLRDRANRIETVGGIDCYLWRTPLHPFNLRRRVLRRAEAVFFAAYERLAPAVLSRWIQDADIVLFESGMAPLFCKRVLELNPEARTLYLASDDLSVIGVSPYVAARLRQAAAGMEMIVPSPRLAASLPPARALHFVPWGIDPAIAREADPSPYSGGLHAVMVGSESLFDPGFFAVAARAFPDISFHVIGPAKKRLNGAANLIAHGPMPFRATLRYIKHARFGIAAWRARRIPEYLADTSNKLMQYGFFGLPSVCPHPAAGDRASRFGYEPGNSASIVAAIRAAVCAGRCAGERWLSWSQAIDRVLEPARFPDTRMPAGVRS